MSDEKQRAMMVADLRERATRGMSGDDAARYGSRMAFDCACRIRDTAALASHYREGLIWLDVESAQIDAAVASIQRGEEPADSIVGKVRAMQAEARGDTGGICGAAIAHALEGVLALLGVTP